MSAIADFKHEFCRYRGLAEAAMGHLDDGQFFQRPGPQVNPMALIVKHMAGNLASRWSDFLTSDGEKPSRQRDQEFVLGEADTRAALMAAWQHGWSVLLATLDGLCDADLERSVTIRGEPHTVRQALLRGVNHAAYHAGQVLYLARLLRPDAPWLTIAPGGSRQHAAGYLRAK